MDEPRTPAIHPESGSGGGEPLSLSDDDKYFWDEDDVLEWCEDHGIDDPSTLQLVICEPQYPHAISGSDMYCDLLPEDRELEDVAPILAAAIEAVNKVIAERAEILCWMPGKYGTSVSCKAMEGA